MTLCQSRHICVFNAVSELTERCGGCGATQMIDTGRDNPTEIERRCSVMARAYAAQSPQLLHWVQQGNKLPKVYR